MASTWISQHIRPSTISPSSITQSLCNTCSRRHASSYRRTRKMQRVSIGSPSAPSTAATASHIIYNPPSSMPNVYHTPAKFLPAADPRRALLSRQAAAPLAPAARDSQPSLSPLAAIASQALSSSSSSTSLPPPLAPVVQSKYHLGPAEIAEIRRLRAEDPRKWTRAALAEKFDCSNFFIGLCAQAPQIKNAQDKRQAAIKAKWSRRKVEAAEDRITRRSLWGRDA